MSKPRKTLRPVRKSIHLPEDIVAQVDLQLFSELEGKVPFAAWSMLLERLLREHLAKFTPAKTVSGWGESGPVGDGG
jgi:hypothetical protein